MSADIIVIRPDRSWERQTLEGSSDSSRLTAMQEAVGGYIEVITFEGWTMIFNEEGKFQHLPVNPLATAFLDTLYPGFARRDVLVGNVLLVGRTASGDTTSLPEKIVEQFTAWEAASQG